MAPKTAFVLSGGASLGAVQVGMVQALYERGIETDLIVGCSVGAINGGFLASRQQGPASAEDLAEVWRGISRGQVFPLNPLTGFFGFFGARDHLIPDRGLRKLIESHLEFERLEEAPVALHVIATDLLGGHELRISEGDAVRALMASAALPGVFPAVEWRGRKLIDGGVSNNAPIADAIELGADRVYVLPTGSACELPAAPRGAVAMVLHATSLLVTRRLLVEAELLRDQAELIVLPPPCPISVLPIDFSHTEELIRGGYEAAGEYLEDGRSPQIESPQRALRELAA